MSRSLWKLLVDDTLAKRLRHRLRRQPAKPMGSPRLGSNPTGVLFAHRRSLRLSNFKEVSHGRAGPRLSGEHNAALLQALAFAVQQKGAPRCQVKA